MKKFVILCGILGLAGTAFAAPPTNEEILTARAQADEAQLVLAQKMMERMQAEEKALANYWASYVAGLEKSEK